MEKQKKMALTEEEKSINIVDLFIYLIAHWKWFVLSILLCCEKGEQLQTESLIFYDYTINRHKLSNCIPTNCIPTIGALLFCWNFLYGTKKLSGLTNKTNSSILEKSKIRKGDFGCFVKIADMNCRRMQSFA